jgi:hypothetical protein
LIDGQIQVRRELIGPFPELGSEHELDRLLAQLNEVIRGLKSAPAVIAHDPHLAAALISQHGEAAARLTIHAKTEVEILKRECILKLHEKKESPTAVKAGGLPKEGGWMYTSSTQKEACQPWKSKGS